MIEENNAQSEFGSTILKCLECGTHSGTSMWLDCEPYCDDCGNHSGIACPECGEQYDHVWGYDKLRKGQ